MKNVISLLIIFITIFSCQEEQLDLLSNDDFSLDGAFDGLGIGKSLRDPVVLKRSEYDINNIIKEISEASFEIGNYTSANSETPSLTQDGFDVKIDPEYIVITPIIDEPIPDSDDKDCGGKEGDGWKSYGRCWTESCVEDKMKEAAEELGEPGVGECLDIRVRRTKVAARVCARMTDC